jgi:cellulose synthase/poly-beta-1,6-N-acetylglucosamine synthase-like glycosyltransferase
VRALHLLTLGLLAWTHVGWGLFVRVARRLGLGRVTDDRESRSAAGSDIGSPASRDDRRTVSVVIAAYAEEDAIAATVAGLAAQTWPRDRLQIVVACDGSTDRTAERARAAGADLVLELPRGGKHHAQAGGVARATGEILAFSDANTSWDPTALEELVAAFDDPQVGYACGRVSFLAEDGATNQEGSYWRLEMSLRRLESDWWSVTAGNGAIYALRAELWSQLRVEFGHDLALPHQVVRGGLRAVDRPTARASEPMVPSIDGEWRRKRRMMNQAWRVVLRGGEGGGLRQGILDPAGLPIPYLAALVSHRWLRYASPFLHLLAYAAGLALLLGRRGGPGRSSRPTLHLLLLAAHLAVPLGAVAAGRFRWRPLLLCRYYVLMTASIAAGLSDHLRHGTPAGWDPAEGTR